MTTTHYFLGIGQGIQAKTWLSTLFPQVIFHEAPNYLLHNTAESIEAKGIQFVNNSIGADTNFILIAESQACPAVVRAIESGSITLPKYLILVQPLGLNMQSLGSNSDERLRSLFRRSARFWLHPYQNLLIAGNRWTFKEITRQSSRFRKNLKVAYTYGSNTDIYDTLTSIAEKVPVHVFASKRDSLFPLAELRLHDNVELHEMSGPHLNRATPRGARQLSGILKYLHTVLLKET